MSCWGRDKKSKAYIKIGTRCSTGDRTEIHAGKHVEICDDVIIALDCVIMDREYHSPSGKNEICKPEVIKNGVWIGRRVIILKGITIGGGAVVAAGSVVTEDVDAHTLVAGNPARRIRRVEGWN